MSGFSRCSILVASLGLVACHVSEGSDAMPAGTGCEANKFSLAHRWETIPTRSFDETARVAAKAAAEAGGVDLAEFKSKYCSYERPAENAVGRCFLFLRNPPTPGGDIKVCVAPDGRVTDTFLGE